MLATGGGLVFRQAHGESSRSTRIRQDHVAVPDRLRNQRQPITYTHNGRQYVTVLSASAADFGKEGDCGKIQPAVRVTFALMPD